MLKKVYFIISLILLGLFIYCLVYLHGNVCEIKIYLKDAPIISLKESLTEQTIAIVTIYLSIFVLTFTNLYFIFIKDKNLEILSANIKKWLDTKKQARLELKQKKIAKNLEKYKNRE